MSNENMAEEIVFQLEEKQASEAYNLEFAAMSNDLVKVYTPRTISKSSYTYDSVKTMMSNPISNIARLQDASDYLYLTSGQYRKLVDLFSTIMNYDMILTPYDIKKDGIENAATMKKTYLNSANWMERFSYKYEFQKITESLVMYGEYFGYMMEGDHNITMMKLPREYCKLGGFIDEVGVVSFDFSYFNSNAESKLAALPKEFTSVYNKFQAGSLEGKDGTTGNWYILSDRSVAFSLTPERRKGLPLFVGSFLDVLEVNEYKEMAKESAALENYALLHLKAPWKKDAKTMRDTLVPLKQLKSFHKNAAKNTPEKVGTAADMLEWELFKFGGTDSSVKSGANNNVESANTRIYDSAGVANALFNNTSNTIEGIKKSIQADEAILFGLLRQYEMFLMRELRTVINANYNWKAKFINTTWFNQEDKMKMYKEAASGGGSKFMFLASTNLTPMEQLRQVEWEAAIGILEMMPPLQTSYTQSGAETNTSGEVTVSDSDTKETVTEEVSSAENFSKPNTVKMKFEED